MAFIEAEQDCGICLEAHAEKTTRICGTCNGSFCFHCIEQWIESSMRPSCPLCRADIEEDTASGAEEYASDDMETDALNGTVLEGTPSTELLYRFNINVLMTWLQSKRFFLSEHTQRRYSAKCNGLLNDAIRSTDLLLKSCLDVLRPGSEQSLEGFAGRLPQLEASFCKLFQKVDMALSHETTARLYGWGSRWH